MENWGLITYRETALLADGMRNAALLCQQLLTVHLHQNPVEPLPSNALLTWFATR